jgi:hypothetical protein
MKYRRAPHTAWRKIGRETIVVDLQAKQMFGLNESGGFLWHAVDAAADLEELARWLAAADSPARVDTGQLRSFCDRLAELGLLTTGVPDETQEAAAPGLEPLETMAPPQILWQEQIQQPPGSCAFLPGQGPICSQTPFQ